jgi:hypothetical protein
MYYGRDEVGKARLIVSRDAALTSRDHPNGRFQTTVI